MDTKMQQLAGLLEAAGYTQRYIEDHWENAWRKRRWYGFEAPDSSILQIITKNTYVRITLMRDGSWRFGRYVSKQYPRRPKTDFFLNPFIRDLKTYDEIVEYVRRLDPRKRWRMV